MSIAAGSGAVRWGQSFGGIRDDEVHDLGVGPGGELVVSGALDVDNRSKPHGGRFDEGSGFVAVWSSDGERRWARRFPDAAPPDCLYVGRSLVVVTGRLGAAVDLGAGPLAWSREGGASFLLGLTLDGVPRWSRSFAQADIDTVLLKAETLFVAGSFQGELRLGEGRPLASQPGAGNFLAAYDERGHLKWQRLLARRDTDPVTLWLDPRGALLVTGGASGVGDLGCGAPGVEDEWRKDVFVASYSVAGGACLWAWRRGERYLYFQTATVELEGDDILVASQPAGQGADSAGKSYLFLLRR